MTQDFSDRDYVIYLINKNNGVYCEALLRLQFNNLIAYNDLEMFRDAKLT